MFGGTEGEGEDGMVRATSAVKIDKDVGFQCGERIFNENKI